MFRDSKTWAITRRLGHSLITALRSGYLWLGLVGLAFIVQIVLCFLIGSRMMWLCAVVDGALVCLSLLEIKRKKNERQQKYRRMHGLCLGCGYDLRETPGRCPECGMIAKPICRACGGDMSDTPEECCVCGAVPPASSQNLETGN